MPLLKREPDLFPETLFSMTTPWRVAHLRSRQEKAFARYLTEYGIGYYLPQTEKRTRRSNRTFVSFLPLFPGYVFFRGEEAERARAIRSNLAVNILTPVDQDGIHGELKQLHDLQMANGRLIPYPEVAPGDAVLITDGVFAGYRGVVMKEKGSERLIVSVAFIRQSVAVEIDREGVKPAAGGR